MTRKFPRKLVDTGNGMWLDNDMSSRNSTAHYLITTADGETTVAEKCRMTCVSFSKMLDRVASQLGGQRITSRFIGNDPATSPIEYRLDGGPLVFVVAVNKL